MSTQKQKLPLIALRGMVILPGMVINFDISRKKSVSAVEKSMSDNQKIFLVAQKNPEVAEPGEKDIYHIGTIAQIKQIMKLPNGILRVMVEGMEKASVVSIVDEEAMLSVELETVEEMESEEPDDMVAEAMVRNIRDLLKFYAVANPKMSKDVIKQLLSIENIEELLQRTAIDLPMRFEKRQGMLELGNIQDRFNEITKILAEETEILKIKEELALKVKAQVEKNQKEYVMREQMKVLHEELDGEDTDSEIDDYFAAVKKLKASKEVKDKLTKEIKRYKTLSGSSSEASVARGYIETLLELPWDKLSKDNNDIVEAQHVLDADHYGLEKVKERIIEFLAVRSVTKKGDAPIICLVGPPGTGKTSIARSIAKALNKKYVRICLGGVRDEAEIRGHRKTYIGAMPGRILEGIKSAGVKNPLMLLDEIDKISSDYKGDTASALLEVLDSEQNIHFRDHYVELPTDLSEVLFIATANDLSTVSRPLLDRMEIIEVNSYTQNEKLHIAKEHLIRKQIKKCNLTEKAIEFSDNAINVIIEGYTREAGVRTLERRIASVCRKVVKEQLEAGSFVANETIVKSAEKAIVKSTSKRNTKTTSKTIIETTGKTPAKKTASIKITEKNLEHYLGKQRYFKDEANKEDDIGIVRGLAWTSVGGDTLEIEVNTMPGKGELKMTGQMGDVMKESAQIALSFVRSIASNRYAVADDYFEKHELHLHIPEGAVPKDGPSAGVTMATAILSAVTEIPVKASVAMTGEITLRGKVLPIGGLKEKMLAAKAAGIKTVLVPEKNKRDVDEFASEITKGIKVIYLKTMDDVISHVFAEKK